MRRSARVLLTLCLVGSTCWANPLAAPTNAADIRPHIEPGIEYHHEWIGNGPWSIHVVKLDRSKKTFQLAATLAQDHVYGLTPVAGQIERLTTATHHPVAAVNGDFFHIRPGPYQGDPLGLQIVNGALVSSPTGASFWESEDGSLHMGEVKAEFRATGSDGFVLDFGLNEKRPADAAVLYTPALGESTRTEGGVELLLEPADRDCWLPLQAGGDYRARIAAINTEGDTRLKPDIMVLSIGPELAAKLPAPVEGQTIVLDIKTLPDLKGAKTALGGGPILLREGKARKWEHRPERHPRTAIGWNAAHLFLVVVDGRQKGLSIGMNYTELSSLMLRLGCTEAMNLDGGGSSTLWLGGCVMNSPSDGRQRSVANGLIVISTQQAETP